MSNIYKPIK